ncbi:uncharacterized protein LOC122951086 isoform X1 [Acropora millepora]|uniref:uncharacterized protein LOC122949011 isoform X1 n=1 Tax=Acropora millepora TaxID=45264 RepID=UPI001CF2F31E|nr:uncharacterized protein LOC122949011 isoform X1 [Acropora millepora]XP_044167058.1 uncharacterized protein LOC122951086 isoform X1 [Acropora millepora]
MVATRHCCWGKCNNDSRYPERLPDSLKEMLKNGQKAFIPFPKPKHDLELCQRWVNACSRQNFSVKNVNYNTYICAVHWPGGKGPTKEFPDPFKANLSEKEDEEPPTRDQSTQTLSNAELKSKIETLITSNALKTSKVVYKTISISSMSYENVIQDSQNMTHLTGLTSSQFKVLFDFLNDVCPLDKIRYWCHGKNSKQINSHKLSSQWSSEERLYICLLRLRRGFTIKTLSLLLSTPDKQIKDTSIREIFTTFIQLMYKVFRDMRRVMFPSKEVLQRFLPRVFKTIKRIRCTVDCTEFRVETSRNFARQGNTYSSYKHANTFKCLIAVTPNGGSCFVSDLYEGDISDVQIFEQSGILKHIEPQDVILVDRGFTVQDLVNPLQACIQIPAFLKGRGNLSAAEELSTRKIAKARVHVERFNQRLKQFKLVGRTIPLSLAPLATQMVVVACGLVNFQEVLCK